MYQDEAKAVAKQIFDEIQEETGVRPLSQESLTRRALRQAYRAGFNAAINMTDPSLSCLLTIDPAA